MKKNFNILFSIASFILICFALSACSKKISETNNTAEAVTGATSQQNDQLAVKAPDNIIGSAPHNAIAKATVFKMSGDYANNVAVTIDAQGNLLYFPAPSDISVMSAPKSIGDGWYLNRQGLSSNSVFTKWTFEEYASLKTVPTPQQIKDAIIPGAYVTAFLTLPVSASEAASMTSAQLIDLIK